MTNENTIPDAFSKIHNDESMLLAEDDLDGVAGGKNHGDYQVEQLEQKVSE